MGTRRERVVLDLDDASFTTGMARDSAAAALLGQQLDIVDSRMQAATKSTRSHTRAVQRHESISKSAVSTLQSLNRELAVNDGRIRQTSNSLPSLTRNSEQSGRSINQLTGRLRALGEVIAILGPGVIPIGAAAIPWITTLLSSGAIAVTTAGALVTALQGVGDAYKALNAYDEDPTAANLEELKRTLDDLAPSAAAFVLESQDLADGLGRLQEAAAERFFSGTIEDLDELQHALPAVRRLFVQLAGDASDVLGMGIDDFDSRSTREWMRYLKSEARPVLTGLYEILRNVAGGTADVIMAMDPLNDNALDGLVGATETFRDWADGVDDAEGFEDFMDYVLENGPKVADATGAIANAMVQIVQAASPLGGPVLEALEFTADAVATIADSDFGPRIITGAAAFLLLNRALSATVGLLRATGFIAAAGAGAAGAAGAAAAGSAGSAPIIARANAVRSGITGLRRDVGAMSREYQGMNRIQSTVISGFSQTSGAAQRARASIAAGSRVVAGATLASAAFAVASTEQGESLNLQNTAMLGLVGSIKGKLGGAIGAGIGLLIDFNSAGERVEQTFGRVNEVFRNSGGTIGDYGQGVSDLMAAQLDYIDTMSTRNLDGSLDAFSFNGIGSAQGWKDRFNIGETSVEMFEADQAEAKKAMDNLVLYWNAQIGTLWDRDPFTGTAMDERWKSDTNPFGYNLDLLEQTDQALTRLQPAMREYGLTMQDLIDLQNGGEIDGRGWEEWNRLLVGYTATAETTEGRTKALTDAIAQLGDEGFAAAQTTGDLATALDALLSPSLNAEAATDAWRQSLRGLRLELNDNAGFAGYRQGAVENRQITRDYVETAKERLTALAGLTETTEKDMAAAVSATRREFIASGIAAGISRREITKRARELGLTPKLVRTVFEAAGITKTELQARRLKEAYDVLPKNVRTELRAEGIPKTEAEVDALVEKYKLTGQERRALVDLQDLASPKMEKILQRLGLVDRAKPNPRVSIDDQGFRAKITAIQNALRTIDGTTATTYVRTVRTGTGQGQKDAPNYRDGGEIRGPGGPRDDLIPIWASNNEFMMRAAAVDKYGKQFMHDVNSLRFAGGGEITRYAAQRAAAASRTVVRVSAPAVSLDGLAVTGSLLTPWGPAQIEGIARSAARSEIAEEKRFDHVHREGR